VDFTALAAAAFKRAGLKPFGFFCVRDSLTYRSRLNTSAEDCVRRHAGRLAGLLPSPALALTLREGANVLLTRAEEIQKVHFCTKAPDNLDYTRTLEN